MVCHAYTTNALRLTDNNSAIVKAAPMLEGLTEPILNEHNSMHLSEIRKARLTLLRSPLRYIATLGARFG